MKIIKKHIYAILLCLFELIVGVLLLINPIGFTTLILFAAGIALLVVGVSAVIKYFRTPAPQAATAQYLSKGLVSLCAGAFCAFGAEWMVEAYSALTVNYGLVIMVVGFGKVQLACDIFRRKNDKWFFALISAALSVICSVLILWNPFSTLTVIWILTGIVLSLSALLDIVTVILGEKADAALVIAEQSEKE